MNRRTFLGLTTAALAGVGFSSGWSSHRAWLRRSDAIAASVVSNERLNAALPAGTSGMRFRDLGRTGIAVSEVGFGAWAIGGQAYGPVGEADALNALSVAEEHGCNFVDTAAVYGRSEEIIGRFLVGRRQRWLVATKFSGQPEGMEALLETQLRRLNTDAIDLYQVHWAPGRSEFGLYDSLLRLKKAGKARFIGVSLGTAIDIDRVLSHNLVDAIQVPFNLLEPAPYLDRLEKIKKHGVAVIIRSSLKGGLLSGKYSVRTRFNGDQDRRTRIESTEVDSILKSTESFRFLESSGYPLAVAAARYPLSFAETSTVIMGTKNAEQSAKNFGIVSGTFLSQDQLRKVEDVQRALGLDGESRFRRVYMRALVDRLQYSPFAALHRVLHR